MIFLEINQSEKRNACGGHVMVITVRFIIFQSFNAV
jgi:hypothetical protein